MVPALTLALRAFHVSPLPYHWHRVPDSFEQLKVKGPVRRRVRHGGCHAGMHGKGDDRRTRTRQPQPPWLMERPWAFLQRGTGHLR